MPPKPPPSTREFRPTRRGFLKSGAAGAALVATLRPAAAQAPEPLESYRPAWFTSAEFAFVTAATGRLIPSGGDGPGAREARVPVFIDRQMLTPFGTGEWWYMQGPHVPDADPKLGYQTPLTPQQIYREGIATVDAWCRSTRGQIFSELPEADQDAVLTALEKGEVPMPATLRNFFEMLLQNTKEGYFSDPIHGGNAGMAAWVYVGFPGARASFREWIDRHDVPYPLGPVSISGERA